MCPLRAGSHVTRFIGLADVGPSAKPKWLHALGLVPAAKMAADVLGQVPADATDCPYTLSSKKRARQPKETSDHQVRMTSEEVRVALSQPMLSTSLRQLSSTCLSTEKIGAACC